ncbi:limbic system-associated membrane protein-like [Colossoma macropomum]|uniref:limbic system-associated membrane protein-like n=1 Tax=Colossoma macropomum TaxID=42526 RepID=UPI0018650382|nr:limbic system-associated membrane protein-like [Colossoma macropomum]
MKVQVLILLATSLAISCCLSEEKEVFVESGSVAVLPCVVPSFNAHSSAVHWKKAIGNELKTVWRRDRSGLEFRPVGRGPRAHCPQPNFGKGDYSLHIEGVREEDGGMYYCVVEGNTVNVKVMLRVVRVSFSPAEVVEGNDLTITCSITPQPGSIVTTWELNGSQEPSQTSIQMLKRSNVSQKESGIWSCLVRRRASSEVQLKASASLQVKGILNPKGNPAVAYAEVGSSVTLPCIFSDGDISDAAWKKVSTTTSLPVSLPPSFKISSSPAVTKWDKSAYIESVEEADQGMYKCSGQMKSADGKGVSVERNIQLVIAQVQRSSRSGQMTLTCDLSDTNQVTQYEWLRLDNSENATHTLTPLQKSTSKVFTIPKGETNNLGGWMCRFYNQQRLLGNVTYHQEMMSAVKGQNESGSSKKVITLIGLSLLLMLVLLILLQMYKNHRRRKMVMQYPAMETIVHLAANERERKERCKARDKELKASCSADMTLTSV